MILNFRGMLRAVVFAGFPILLVGCERSPQDFRTEIPPGRYSTQSGEAKGLLSFTLTEDRRVRTDMRPFESNGLFIVRGELSKGASQSVSVPYWTPFYNNVRKRLGDQTLKQTVDSITITKKRIEIVLINTWSRSRSKERVTIHIAGSRDGLRYRYERGHIGGMQTSGSGILHQLRDSEPTNSSFLDELLCARKRLDEERGAQHVASNHKKGALSKCSYGRYADAREQYYEFWELRFRRGEYPFNSPRSSLRVSVSALMPSSYRDLIAATRFANSGWKVTTEGCFPQAVVDAGIELLNDASTWITANENLLSNRDYQKGRASYEGRSVTIGPYHLHVELSMHYNSNIEEWSREVTLKFWHDDVEY